MKNLKLTLIAGVIASMSSAAFAGSVAIDDDMSRRGPLTTSGSGHTVEGNCGGADYQDATAKLFIEQECPICLENFVENETIAILPCGHVFHIECVAKWFAEKYECPSCRFRTNWYKKIVLNN